jgi:hypothetical protein
MSSEVETASTHCAPHRFAARPAVCVPASTATEQIAKMSPNSPGLNP